jgi:hypothetical protein
MAERFDVIVIGRRSAGSLGAALRAHGQLTRPGVNLFSDLEALERRHLTEGTARGLSNVATEVHLA